MLAISFLDPTLYAVLICVGLVLSVIALVMSKFVSILAWACVVVFVALAWNALSSV